LPDWRPASTGDRPTPGCRCRVDRPETCDSGSFRRADRRTSCAIRRRAGSRLAPGSARHARGLDRATGSIDPSPPPGHTRSRAWRRRLIGSVLVGRCQCARRLRRSLPRHWSLPGVCRDSCLDRDRALCRAWRDGRRPTPIRVPRVAGDSDRLRVHSSACAADCSRSDIARAPEDMSRRHVRLLLDIGPTVALRQQDLAVVLNRQDRAWDLTLRTLMRQPQVRVRNAIAQQLGIHRPSMLAQ
jgi:hypothetical protein